MNIDIGFIAAIIRLNAPEVLFKTRITPSMLGKDFAQVFEHIKQHYIKYDRICSFEILKGLTNFDFATAADEPLDFWEEKIVYRFAYEQCKGKLLHVFEKFDHSVAEPGKKLVDDLDLVIRGIREGINFEEQSTDGFDYDLFKQMYEEKKAGLRGISTPYPTWNEGIGGFMPEDLITVAARPSIGKTFFILNFLHHVWLNKKKVFFASTEMSKKAIVRRLYAMHLKYSYSRIAKANLNDFDETEMFEKAAKVAYDDNFIIFHGGMKADLEAIELNIMANKPDFVAIDGAYLLKSAKLQNKDRYQRIADMMDLLKELAKKCNVPVMITTQLNRDSGGNGGKANGKKKGLERMAFSDNLAMVSDYVFFLDQTDEEKSNKAMRVEPKKLREIEDPCAWNDLMLHWDFDKMDFSENPFYKASNE